MLVSGLENSSLSEITSGGKVDYLQVHKSLCECAHEILDKYQQKKESSPRLVAKTEAVQVLLHQLGKASSDPDETRMLISSALEKHAEALQGKEHLLSRGGNNYALMEQTKGLGKEGDAPASLLRYHRLKDELLMPDSPLDAKQKLLVFVLAEKRMLTLKILEAVETNPVEALKGYEHLLSEKGNNYALMEQTKGLGKEGDAPASPLGYHELKDKFLGPASPLNAEQKAMVAVLAEKGGLTLKILETMKASPDRTAVVIEELHKAGLLEPDWCERVFNHKNPFAIAAILNRLYGAGLLKPDLLDLRVEEVFKLKRPLDAFVNVELLNREGLLKPGLPSWWIDALKHKDSVGATKAVVELKQHNLNSLDNCYAVVRHNSPFDAASAIIYLVSHNKLTARNRELVLAEEFPLITARRLCT